jgi:penicillin-binding protein 2
LALKLGVEKILEYAKKFGFAEKTKIEMPFEKNSVVYSPRWKECFLKEPWHLGETLNLAIGQGYISTTLLQLARFMACLATKGKLFNLRIIEKIGEREINYSTFRNVCLRNDVWETLHRGMNKVVKEGTGKAAAVPHLNIYGKTGTSQNLGEDHSWFCCFAGRESPTIALVIMIEHGGPGGKTAAPLARKILSSLEL